MKKILFILFCLVAIKGALCQQGHVYWRYEVKKKTGGTYDAIITAYIDHPWHLYSQHNATNTTSTSFVFDENPMIETVGNVKEIGKLEKISHKSLGKILSYWGAVKFVQTFKVKRNIKTNVGCTIQYLVRDDSHILPSQKISFDLKLE
jgi:hypothetical protein